ncbi:MAG: exonuclease SbcCD subunit D [Lautropia sp.]
MPRLLHTADWQIGRQYGRFAGEDAAVLAQARFAAVERIAALATERGADAVLVAGDVFDLQAVSDRTIRRLFHALAGFTGPWLLLPGNHDAALAESVWSRARRLDCIPANVRVCEQPGVITLDALGIAVLAAPLTQRQTHDDLTAFFDDAETPPGMLRIGLAHGSVTGVLPESADSPNPIAADRAGRARLDYLALGDWHGSRRIDARTWYSGTPEPDRFRGNEPGNVLLVELAALAEPRVETVPVARHRWHERRFEFTVASDVDRFAAELAAIATDDVVALALSGRVDLDAGRRIREQVEIVRGRTRALEVDDQALRLVPTDADVAALAADGYLGDVLVELREQSDDPIAAEALALLAGLLADRACS